MNVGMREAANARRTRPVYTVIQDNCYGCSQCGRKCPTGAPYKTDYTPPGKRLPAFAIDQAKCIKCGACLPACKFHAIVVDYRGLVVA